MTMSAITAEDRIAGIESRLDFIVEELGHMKRVRNEAEDLMADLTLVARDAFGEATTACESMNLRPQEIVHLFKAALRDANLLTAALQQLESAADLIQDMQPIARDLYQQAVTGCGTLQEKGYFGVVQTGMRIGDALVKAHSAEDLKQMEASVPQFVGFLRELTRPDALQALEAILHGFAKVQATMDIHKSLFKIVRDLNSPDARRGIAILVEFLKVVGSSNTGSAGASTSER
ncbi:MAG TPA: DUF1641 domain-containing protein [Acidisarcina sp.]|nr:DUF1641 domain-containing protein [Acidisarcina sp.]